MNPDKLHTAGHPYSTGRKEEKKDSNKPIDKYGRTKNEDRYENRSR